MAVDKDVAIRKRQQIDSSKKTMFIFVAGAAFVVGIALVVSYFLAHQIFFHTKVIGEKYSTISQLNTNLESIKELKSKIRVLETSSALNSIKLKDDSNALQPILDALPDNANPDALGASLQNKFIGAVDGLTLEALDIHSTDSDSSNGSSYNTTTASVPSIGFSMSVRGSADNLKKLLTMFEKSIRVIDIVSAELQANEDDLVLKIEGRAYYEPAQIVQLETKVVKP